MLIDTQSIEAIKDWQKLMYTVHPSVEQELIKLALVLFIDAKGCEIEIDLPNKKVNVYLEPYTGFKYLYNKYYLRLNKLHLDRAKRLAQTFQFWMPCSKDGSRPVIEIFWR